MGSAREPRTLPPSTHLGRRSSSFTRHRVGPAGRGSHPGARRTRPVRTTHRELAELANPAQLDWLVASALVGAHTGTIVIDGHVDSATTGHCALFRLTNLSAGDRIVVTTTTAQSRTYLVSGRRIYYRKAHGLPPSTFTTTGAPRLVRIACGGPFSPTTGSHLDNIVTFAAPAPRQLSA